MADFLKPGGEFFSFLFQNVTLLGSDAIFYYNETAVRLELTVSLKKKTRLSAGNRLVKPSPILLRKLFGPLVAL